MSEKKVITKSDNVKTMVRDAAQKVNFDKLRELIQRNVKENYRKTYMQYNCATIEQYSQSPANNISNIREVSRFLTRVSMLYKLMVWYMGTMPLYNYNVTAVDVDWENPEKVSADYMKVVKKLHKFNIKSVFKQIGTSLYRDGMYVGWTVDSDDGTYIMPLDLEFCRIYGKTKEGQWIVYFDAKYFDKDNNIIFVKGVNNDGVGVWDKCFIDGYNNYKNLGRDFQWFRLTPEKTACFISGSEDEFYAPLPFFFPLFKSLLRILDTENLIADKDELQNYKLVLNKIPFIKNSNMVDDFAISDELVEFYDSMMREILPDLVGWGTVPYDSTEVIDFGKTISSAETDELNRAMNNLFSNAGINRLIVSSGESSNANGIKYSIANDLGKISVFLNDVERWLNYWLENNVAKGFYVEVFDQTQYNRSEFITEKKEAASLGGSKMDYLCALGMTPYAAYNKIMFEDTILDPLQFMSRPLKSSYTMSAEESEGGRPAMDETELTDEGLATRESGKNEDKGA